MEFRDVTQDLKSDLTKVEEAINQNYKSDVPLIPGISSYMMSCGGKRIRPMLVLLGAILCGRETDDTVVKHGCAVEYLHAATLLHDDVVDERRSGAVKKPSTPNGGAMPAFWSAISLSPDPS